MYIYTLEAVGLTAKGRLLAFLGGPVVMGSPQNDFENCINVGKSWTDNFSSHEPQSQDRPDPNDPALLPTTRIPTTPHWRWPGPRTVLIPTTVCCSAVGRAVAAATAAPLDGETTGEASAGSGSDGKPLYYVCI